MARYKTEADKERAKLQKQLSLVDEALKNIPSSIQLFEMKLQFMSNLLAADDFAVQLECLIKKDSTNLALWQALITTMKLSVALCNVNKINELMIRRFNIFRHKFKLSSSEHDTKLLGQYPIVIIDLVNTHVVILSFTMIFTLYRNAVRKSDVSETYRSLGAYVAGHQIQSNVELELNATSFNFLWIY